MADLTGMSPREIDEQLAQLYLAEQRAMRDLAMANDSLHYALDERRVRAYGRRSTWPTTHEEALARVQAKVADPGYQEVPWGTSPAKALAEHTKATLALQENAAAQEVYHLEYRRRGWSRFFTVQQHNGHIHSSMNCQTCNRNGSVTEFGWNPDLSGLTEAEAVAKLGPSLCTVCFPSAPVEWTVGRQPEHCSGSRERPAGDERRRYGRTVYARCQGCGELELLTMAGVVKAHKPKKS